MKGMVEEEPKGPEEVSRAATGRGERRPGPGRWRMLGFALFSLIGFFGLLEGGLWLAGGLLSRWRSLEPLREASGELPVVCTGDSVTFGLGADTAESYPARLEASESGRRLRLRVVNLAKAGQPLRVALGELEGYLRQNALQGAVVLLLGGFNDCFHLPGMAAPGGSEPPVRAWHQVWLKRSRTYRLMQHGVGWLAGPPGPGRIPPEPPLNTQEAGASGSGVSVGEGRQAAGQSRDGQGKVPERGLDLSLVRCRAELVEGAIPAALQLAQKYKLRLHFLTYPVPSKPRNGGVAWVSTRINRMLRESQEALDFSLLAVDTCVRARELQTATPLFQADDIHLTAAGYQAMADCVGTDLLPTLGLPE